MFKFLKKHWKWVAGLAGVGVIAFFGVQHYLKQKSAVPKGIAWGNGRIESTQVDRLRRSRCRSQQRRSSPTKAIS